MSASRWSWAGVSIVAMAVLVSMPIWAQPPAVPMERAPAAMPKPTATHEVEMHQMQMKRVEGAVKAVDAAIMALEADQKDKAMAEMKAAKVLLADCHKAMKEMHPGKVVNVRCPIMGTKIDSDNVPENLTRTFKGHKVGFCCGGCPLAWDGLSDAEKQQKLQAVMPPEPKEKPLPQPKLE